MAVELRDDNFQKEVIDSKLLVLVDFWAPWCGPCRLISSHIERLADDYAGKLKVCKLNVDQAPKVATRYTVMSIPTLLLLDKGKVLEKRAGALGKEEIEKFIRPYLK